VVLTQDRNLIPNYCYPIQVKLCDEAVTMTTPKEHQHQKCEHKGHKFILVLLFVLFITLVVINELILQKMPNTTRPKPTKSYYSGPTSKLMNTTYIDSYLIWTPDKNQSNYRFKNETEPKKLGYKIDISQVPNLSFNQYFPLYNGQMKLQQFQQKM